MFLSNVNNCVSAQSTYFHLKLDCAESRTQTRFLHLLYYLFVVGQHDNARGFVKKLVRRSKNQNRLFYLWVDG